MVNLSLVIIQSVSHDSVFYVFESMTKLTAITEPAVCHFVDHSLVVQHKIFLKPKEVV